VHLRTCLKGPWWRRAICVFARGVRTLKQKKAKSGDVRFLAPLARLLAEMRSGSQEAGGQLWTSCAKDVLACRALVTSNYQIIDKNTVAPDMTYCPCCPVSSQVPYWNSKEHLSPAGADQPTLRCTAHSSAVSTCRIVHSLVKYKSSVAGPGAHGADIRLEQPMPVSLSPRLFREALGCLCLHSCFILPHVLC
jgi:hypothetical protein